MLLINGPHPLYFLSEAIPRFIYIKCYHRAHNRGKYADGFYISMINDKDGHIPLPLIMSTCTALRHALLERQKNKGVHPKASKSKLKADRPDPSNYFNYKHDAGKNASCFAAMGRKLLTLPGVAETYIILMNIWNTLPESYQQRVHKNTLATVKRQIQQAENPTPAVVISVETVRVDNAILLDYMTSEFALEEPEIGSTDPNIPIDNNCTDDELHFGMPGASGEYKDDVDECDYRDAFPTSSRRCWSATQPEWFDLRTFHVNGYEGEVGNDADADANADVDEEGESSQAHDGSKQNVKVSPGNQGYRWV
jgi:hypothetical protein